MSEYKTPHQTRRLVRVEGRDDVGEIIDRGHNFVSASPIYCIRVHFPKDGLCAYYDSKRVTIVESGGIQER